ncbi:TPA: hypothetical protein KJY76_004038 [Shigella flexneri]|nr:hypothetical protein [Shigella flexneri]
MALPFETINTRKIALAASFGYAPYEVASDGIDEDGITVTAVAYNREQKPSGFVTYESDSPFVRVAWDTSEQANLAIEAREEDWAETLATLGLSPVDTSHTGDGI